MMERWNKETCRNSHRLFRIIGLRKRSIWGSDFKFLKDCDESRSIFKEGLFGICSIWSQWIEPFFRRPGIVKLLFSSSAASRIVFFIFGSRMTEKCHGWRLAPLGAVTALPRQASSTPSGIRRSEKSRTLRLCIKWELKTWARFLSRFREFPES